MRRGYEVPALPLRLVGIHSLLCDGCNLSYRGFAIPGTVPTHTPKKKRYYRRGESPEELEAPESKYSEVAQEEGVKALEALSFGWYYAKLRFKVLFGMHQTTHSVGLKFRWRHWQRLQRDKNR